MAVSLLVCALYSAACLSAGALFRRSAAPGEALEGAAALSIVASDFLLGLCVLSLVLELPALFGLFSPTIVAVVVLVSILGGIREAATATAAATRRAFALLKTELRSVQLPEKVAVLLTIVCVATSGFASLYPLDPYGDAEGFYLAVAKVVAASHRLSLLPTPYQRLMQNGLTGEMHLAALFSLGAGTEAKVLLWFAGLAAAAMLASIASWAGLGRRGQWTAVAMLFTSTAFTGKLVDGKFDLIAAAMGLAAVLFVLLSDGGERAAPLRLAGFLGGSAVVAKMSYSLLLPPALLVLLVLGRAGRGWRVRELGRTLLTLSTWAALALTPHMLKNAVLFGEPFVPFVALGPRGIALQAYARSWQSWFQSSTTTRIFLTYPFALVYGHFWDQEGNLSPLFLAFTPLVLLRPHPWGGLRASRLAGVVAAGGSGLLVWVLCFPRVFALRYMLASLLLLFLVGARGAEDGLADRTSWLRGSIWIVLVGSLGLSTLDLGGMAGGGLLMLAGRITECDFVRPFCRAAKLLNKQADPSERVFMVANFRYHLRPEIQQCLQSSEESQDLDALKEPEERWRFLHEHGFRYLVMDEIVARQLKPLMNAKDAPGWLRVVPLIEEDGPVWVYRLDSADSEPEPRIRCIETEPRAWRAAARTP